MAPEPNKPGKRRWRWWQYRLSTMLVVTTIISIALGLVKWRVDRQQRVVALISEVGGSVRYDFERDGGRRWGELPGPDWLCRMLGVDYFADVVEVSNITDATCSHLAGLTNLQSLTLGGRLSDAGLAHLPGLTNLQIVLLEGSQVTDAGLTHLDGLRNLKWLDLSGTRVTDAGLTHLRRLPKLQLLSLARTEVTDEGCYRLQHTLPHCYVDRLDHRP